MPRTELEDSLHPGATCSHGNHPLDKRTLNVLGPRRLHYPASSRLLATETITGVEDAISLRCISHLEHRLSDRDWPCFSPRPQRSGRMRDRVGCRQRWPLPKEQSCPPPELRKPASPCVDHRERTSSSRFQHRARTPHSIYHPKSTPRRS